jgi:Protein of unknown function (DUF2652)
MATEPACLLIADISGYTGYLAGVELDHAQDILADLMGAIVSALRPGFRLAKLEGDAAFTFAVTDRIDGSLLLDTIERCYFGFRRRRRDVHQANTCGCNACLHIPDLDLKFVVHHGEILRQRIAGGEELLGSDVILAHRLLKNDVVASTAPPPTRCSARRASTRWTWTLPRSGCGRPPRPRPTGRSSTCAWPRRRPSRGAWPRG